MFQGLYVTSPCIWKGI